MVLFPWNTGWSADCHFCAPRQLLSQGSRQIRREASSPLCSAAGSASCAFLTMCRTKAGELLLQPNSNSRSQSVSSDLHFHSRGKIKWKPWENKIISEKLRNVNVQWYNSWKSSVNQGRDWVKTNSSLCWPICSKDPREKSETRVPFITLSQEAWPWRLEHNPNQPAFTPCLECTADQVRS